jgi:hypothetical protein
MMAVRDGTDARRRGTNPADVAWTGWRGWFARLLNETAWPPAADIWLKDIVR